MLKVQRQRRLVWSALTQGRFESWDWQGHDDGRVKYIRSQTPLDELERKARFPIAGQIPATVEVGKSGFDVVVKPVDKRLADVAGGRMHYR